MKNYRNEFPFDADCPERSQHYPQDDLHCSEGMKYFSNSSNEPNIQHMPYRRNTYRPMNEDYYRNGEGRMNEFNENNRPPRREPRPEFDSMDDNRGSRQRRDYPEEFSARGNDRRPQPKGPRPNDEMMFERNGRGFDSEMNRPDFNYENRPVRQFEQGNRPERMDDFHSESDMRRQPPHQQFNHQNGPGRMHDDFRDEGHRPEQFRERPRPPKPPFEEELQQEKLQASDDLSFLLAVAAGKFNKRGGRRNSQNRVLDILSRYDIISQQQLQEILGIKPGSLSELLQKLENKGYIEKIKSEEDKRKVYIRITEAGRQNKEEMIVENDQFSNLTIEEQETLKTLLKKLLVNDQQDEVSTEIKTI